MSFSWKLKFYPKNVFGLRLHHFNMHTFIGTFKLYVNGIFYLKNDIKHTSSEAVYEFQRVVYLRLYFSCYMSWELVIKFILILNVALAEFLILRTELQLGNR